MSEMIVKLTWDEDDLGPAWMNPDNLAILLYSIKHTNHELLQFEILSIIEEQEFIKNK